ncbi:MAG TPA: PLP-dependent aminotransferase family protein [Chitinophaga sp.]|uniref:aminotransferase-like domain-containing protein n=1 Tax=Chitinophaga sp. TaxID=1869181 RepID=UPI002B534AC5|nr:PLP-dependent aminotransferase family protein [Chitinophaga sp.]HVI47769.1 PLP-dependent aminotransferase family protein [Chitinophaga sp.]
MLPFKTLIIIDKKSRQHIYLQVAGRMIALIQEGVLKPGQYLPGSRVLAEQLKLHRKTIVAAYEELVSQDWIVPVARKGMMVATNLPAVKPRTFQTPASPYADTPRFSFAKVPSAHVALQPGVKGNLIINDGFPDVRLAPLELWLKECRSIIQNTRYQQHLLHGSGSGNHVLQSEMMKYLSVTRGLNIMVDNIMITRGAQMAIYLAASLLVKKGDYVIVGNPNYYYADLCFEQLGVRMLRVPVDKDGIDVEAVEKLCRTKKISMMYVISHHHHPTTVTLSAERRMKLLEIIRRYNIPVIEDDYDYDFHYSSAPIVPLASADHGGNVIYIGSLTKSLGLSLRLGFMIGPAAFISEAASLRKMLDLRGDNLSEEAVAMLLANGTIDRHLKKSNKIYQERRDQLTYLLQMRLEDVVQFEPPAGGMATWVTFSRKYPLPAIAEKAAALGLRMSGGEVYSHGIQPLNGLRFGFASLNNKELTACINVLEKVIRGRK